MRGYVTGEGRCHRCLEYFGILFSILEFLPNGSVYIRKVLQPIRYHRFTMVCMNAWDSRIDTFNKFFLPEFCQL